MMSCENHSPIHSSSNSRPTNPSSLPSTPSFVRKFRCSNFRPLDLRKLTFYGQTNSTSISSTNTTSNSTPIDPPSTTSSPHSYGSGYFSSSSSYCGSGSEKPSRANSQDGTSSTNASKPLPKIRHFTSCRSHDSFIIKRQSSQTRLRESLLASLLLSPRTKEIEFTVPQTLSPLTPTFGRKGLNSGDSSPGSYSGSRSETDASTSRANTPSPIFFRGCSGTDISGACSLGGLNPELYKKNVSEEDDGDGDDSDDENDMLNGYPIPSNELEKQQAHNGRVWFSMEYNSDAEKLHVTVIKAKNLVPKRNSLGTSSMAAATGSPELECNPVVRLSLFPDERRTLQSKKKKLTRNPHFNETFGFQISRAGLEERSLKLCIFDVDSCSKKYRLLGYVIQPLKDIDWSFGKQVFKENLLRDSTELSPNVGEVLVSLCYNSSISRLTVSIFEAKGIKSKESASGLYAKISFSQHTKIIKTKKTSTVSLMGCGSSFNESFNFKAPAEILDTASITIQLMYSQPGYNKDQSAGRIVLGSFMFARGKGLDHWTEMLSKQKEHIQYWHAVSE